MIGRTRWDRFGVPKLMESAGAAQKEEPDGSEAQEAKYGVLEAWVREKKRLNHHPTRLKDEKATSVRYYVKVTWVDEARAREPCDEVSKQLSRK